MSHELPEIPRSFVHRKIAWAPLGAFSSRTSARTRTPFMRLSLAVLLVATFSAQAQGPTGRFLRAAVAVCQPLDYELRYEHAASEEVIFPDSLARFAPFEYVGRTWQPTRTANGRSIDRTVYHLRTFSLAPVQMLQLPVLVLQGTTDTLRLLPPAAQVQLQRTAPQLSGNEPGPPALRQDLGELPLEPVFNYPFWLAGLAGLLLLAVGVAVLFGQRWRRRYQLYKRRKNHVYFLAQFARHAERFTLSRSATLVERAVALWKNYLSSLEDTNLSSLTTKELVEHFNNNDDVLRALRATDRVVYGNLLSEDAQEVDAAFQRLRNFAERQYEMVNG
jgi:hypothetical protein